MSRIVFVMLHPGFIRYYEDALHALAGAGHHVHVAFEISRDKLGESVLAQRLAASSDRITCGTTPPRAESVRVFLARGDRSADRSGAFLRPASGREGRQEAWDSLATTVRLALDYLRFFDPAFAGAEKLRDRAEKRLPRACASLVRAAAAGGVGPRRALATALHGLERMVPANEALDAFLHEQRPDLLLVTPLIELGSQQVDYVKSARRLGIRSALCVASWDNLTSKGLIRVLPDHVIVWNEAQKQEAVALHGVPADRVVITGAQLFDRWFDGKPSRPREEFCRMVGLDPTKPFVLYAGSSVFIAPDEVPFVERWMARLRADRDPAVASLGVLLRPHPANVRPWRTLDMSAWDQVAMWPAIGSDPNSADFRRDYFDSLYHSAAVIGINTSAQLEAGIVGRQVFTIETPEFAHSQRGTLHFKHLVNPDAGLVHSARTLDEHIEQLAGALRAGPAATEANRRFVRSFIRPFGEDVPAVPRFVEAVESLLRRPAPAAPREPAWVQAGRPVAFGAAWLARLIAEDRPWWVYALRPVLAAGVWAAVSAYRIRSLGGELRPRLKRARRDLRRGWRESSKAMTRRWQRTRKTLTQGARRVAGGARRAVVRRAAVRGARKSA